MKNEEQTFVYSATVEEVQTENELNIEIFPYTNGLDCKGEPVQVITNFDDLILFIEQMPDKE